METNAKTTVTECQIVEQANPLVSLSPENADFRGLRDTAGNAGDVSPRGDV